MKKIAYRENFEACNKNGDTVFIDLFMVKDGDSLTAVAYGTTHLGQKSLTELDDEFEDNELQGWIDEIDGSEYFAVVENCELDSGINFNDLRKALNEMMRGSNGPIPPMPTVVYMPNDENTLTDRDQLEYEFFYARLYYELFVLDLVID